MLSVPLEVATVYFQCILDGKSKAKKYNEGPDECGLLIENEINIGNWRIRRDQKRTVEDSWL